MNSHAYQAEDGQKARKRQTEACKSGAATLSAAKARLNRPAHLQKLADLKPKLSAPETTRACRLPPNKLLQFVNSILTKALHIVFVATQGLRFRNKSKLFSL